MRSVVRRSRLKNDPDSLFLVTCYMFSSLYHLFFGAHELVVYACTVSRVFMYLSMFDGISMGIELLTDEMRHTPKWEIWRFIWISVNFTEMLYFQYNFFLKKQISFKISTATNFAAFFDNSLKMFKCFPILTLFKFYGYFFHLGVCLCLPVCVYVCIYDAIKFN